MKQLGIGAACLAIAILTFFQFPGHTWLQQDSQIYAPILEHLRDPSALRNEILASKPHVAYTLYDETALGLRALTGLSFERVLAAMQIVARAFGVFGLFLIASALLPGRPAPWALFAAAICSLGATIAGPSVLTVEYEPTPRALALPLAVCAIGLLAAANRFPAAGLAGSVAAMFHPPTALPFWALYAAVAVLPDKPERKRGRVRGVAPLAIAAAVLLAAAQRQQGGAEAQAFFARLSPFLESLQRMRASYNWISTWDPAVIWGHAAAFAILAAAFLRLRRDMRPALRLALIGLPLAGMLAMPASWLLLDRLRWALVPQYQPMRYLLFVTLFAQLLSAVAGLRAASSGRAWEAVLWFAAAYLPAAQPFVTQPYSARVLALIAGLALTAWIAARAARSRPAFLALGLAAFFAIPWLGGVVNYPALRTPELRQLSDWARGNTPRDAVFLFAGAGRSLDPGVFRAEALRAVYVDWKGGGQVNYIAGFAEEWWTRWRITLAKRFQESDLPRYEALAIGYVVLQPKDRLARAPAFENSKYVVYALPAR